jgi:predicted small secreted protein
MKKVIVALFCFILIPCTTVSAAQKDLEIQGKKLVSQKPPFTLILPSEFNLVHFFSHENPGESSLTRVYFLVKSKGKQVEEMLILQIADKTNPQAGPMIVTPLRPYTEQRLYSMGKVKKGELEVDYLIQLMAWNPDSPSLQPIVKKGLVIPSHWALQGQFLFSYLGEHAVLFRYSKDVNSSGIKVSEKGEEWGKGVIKGNEKRAYETFQKSFMETIDSIQLKK